MGDHSSLRRCLQWAVARMNTPIYEHYTPKIPISGILSSGRDLSNSTGGDTKVADNTVGQEEVLNELDMDEAIEPIKEPQTAGKLPRRSVLWG
jgi:hypothetical protein